jgi:hypothetical protein
MFYLPTLTYSSAGGYAATPKLPALFQYTDRVAGNGYNRTIHTAFTTDETLLCRAEAYIMREEYDKATDDLALWMSNHTASTITLTRDSINAYYGRIAYHEWNNPSVKKELHPDFPIVSDEQENFLHCLLHFRRIETIHEGLRWYDVKRFGIVIQRREVDAANVPSLLDELPVDDPRRAIQLPDPVIKAGMTPNPRNK